LVIATASQQRWSYDTGVNNFATMAVSSDGDMTLSGSNYGTGTFAAGDIHIDASGRINLQADAGSFQFQRPGNTNRFTIDTSQGEVYLTNIQNTSTIFRGLTNQTTQLTIDPANTRVLLPTTHSVAFRDANTTIKSIAANNLRVTAPGTVGISNDLEITGSLTLGGTEITSTAAELNLLDASNGSPSAGAWGAVERIGVYTIAGAKAGSAIGGGGTNHVLGTLPAGAYVTEAYLDVTSVFAVAGGAVAISLGTATTYPAASRPFLEVCQPSAIPRTGGTIDATSATGVITLSAGSGFSPDLFPGAKLPAQENVILNVADGGGGTDGVTASGATLILKYIVM
jgi:phage baseplate assembly protein gpV